MISVKKDIDTTFGKLYCIDDGFKNLITFELRFFEIQGLTQRELLMGILFWKSIRNELERNYGR